MKKVKPSQAKGVSALFEAFVKKYPKPDDFKKAHPDEAMNSLSSQDHTWTF